MHNKVVQRQTVFGITKGFAQPSVVQVPTSFARNVHNKVQRQILFLQNKVLHHIALQVLVVY